MRSIHFCFSMYQDLSNALINRPYRFFEQNQRYKYNTSPTVVLQKSIKLISAIIYLVSSLVPSPPPPPSCTREKGGWTRFFFFYRRGWAWDYPVSWIWKDLPNQRAVNMMLITISPLRTSYNVMYTWIQHPFVFQCVIASVMLVSLAT